MPVAIGSGVYDLLEEDAVPSGRFINGIPVKVALGSIVIGM